MKKSARILIMLFVMLMAIPASAKQASAASAPSAPTLSSIENATSGVKLTWTKVSDATGYYVYRMKTGNTKFSKIATVSSGSTVTYTDTTAKNGSEYSYTVKAYNSKGKTSDASNPVGTIMYLTTPGTLKTSGSPGENKITLKWTENSKATGYRVYRRNEKGKYEKIATVKKSSTTKYADTAATIGAENYYKVTAYYGDYESEGSTDSYIYRVNAVYILDPSQYYAISAKVSLSGSGTGYQTKLVIGSDDPYSGDRSVKLGIQYDRYAMQSTYTGMRALLFENIQDRYQYNQYAQYNGKNYLDDDSYTLTLTVEKSTGKVCGYVNYYLVLTDTNPSLAGHSLYCGVEGGARAQGDSVDTTFSDLTILSNGKITSKPTVSSVQAAKGLSVSAEANTTVSSVRINGTLTGLASNITWDTAQDNTNGYVRLY